MMDSTKINDEYFHIAHAWHAENKKVDNVVLVCWKEDTPKGTHRLIPRGPLLMSLQSASNYFPFLSYLYIVLVFSTQWPNRVSFSQWRAYVSSAWWNVHGCVITAINDVHLAFWSNLTKFKCDPARGQSVRVIPLTTVKRGQSTTARPPLVVESVWHSL